MGLLDFDETYKPLYQPPHTRDGKKRQKETALSQEARDTELNNFGREEVTEDFSDSPHADRV